MVTKSSEISHAVPVVPVFLKSYFLALRWLETSKLNGYRRHFRECFSTKKPAQSRISLGFQEFSSGYLTVW